MKYTKPNWKAETQSRVKAGHERFNELLKEEQSIVYTKKVKGYDKYALTSAEEKTLAQLEAKKESLKFLEKKNINN